jgi:ankyrin repeat protein
MKTLLTLILALVLPSAFFLQAAEPAPDALQQGLLAEEVNHDLGAAINAYQTVLRQFAEQRKFAATALYRLGECYRKQGKADDAIAQFQRLVREFPDQAALVAMSQKYLAETLPSRAGSESSRLLNVEFSAHLSEGFRPKQGPAAIGLSPADYWNVYSRDVNSATNWRENGELAELLWADGSPSPVSLRVQNAGGAWGVDTSDLMLRTYLYPLSRQGEITVTLDHVPPGLYQFYVYAHGQPPEENGVVELISAGKDYGRMTTSDKEGWSDLPWLEGKQFVLFDHVEAEAGRPIVLRIKPGDSGLAMINGIQMLKLLPNGSAPNLAALHDPASARFQTRLQSIVKKEEPNPLQDEEAREIARIREMIKNSPDLINARYQGVNGNQTPLDSAAAKGQLTVAQFLLDNSADVNGGAAGEQTPLHAAVANGHKAMVELLLARGADLNAPDAQGATPLHLAASHGYLSVAQALLSKGADVNGRDKGGETALHLAVRARQKAMIDLLLSHNAQINAQDSQGYTPLMFAVGSGQPALVELLLDKGPELNLLTKRKNSALSLSIGGPQYAQITQVLLAHGANPNQGENDFTDQGVTQKGAPLHWSVHNGDLPLVEDLLKYHADVNALDGSGRTALDWAVLKQNDALVKLLLEKGADPNVKTPDSQTALGFALALLDAYRRPGAPGPSERLPTGAEITEANIQALLNHGADPDTLNTARETFRQTPLMTAINLSDTNLFDLLLAKGADVNLKGAGGDTPLHVAAAHGDTNAISVLLSKGANINDQDENGDTPLHFAAYNLHKEAVELLLAHGASPDIADKRALTSSTILNRARPNYTSLGIPAFSGGRRFGPPETGEEGNSPAQREIKKLLHPPPTAASPETEK